MLARVICLVAVLPFAGNALGADVLFNRDIRPILADKCYACHGPDAAHRQADLRLDQRDAAVEFGAIVPGDVAASTLIERILSDDPDVRMPPAESNKSLTDEEKALLQRWIESGAEYQGHWAYEPPVRPDAPSGPDGIDALLAKSHEQHELTFSPEVDRRTLIRRLYFDLTGLPPTYEEVAAFEADTSPEAYAQLVEKLLGSLHYGERMALPWLDVVRYGDTIGYHSDTPRNVWPYRDWVIKSFNENKPFDQFTIEQLAGDLLEGSTQDQKIASAFNRMLLTTEEGGAQAKDYEARYLTDRVRAVGTVWLGQTTGCCQCHDHKFDPISTRDFYALGAFFADIQEPIIGHPGPGMLVPNPEQTLELQRLKTAVHDWLQYYEGETPEVVQARDVWEQSIRDEIAAGQQWIPLHPESVASVNGVAYGVEEGEVIFAPANPNGGTDVCTVTVKTTLSGITAFRIDALPDDRLPGHGPGRAASGNFVLSELAVTSGERPVPLKSATASFAQMGLPAEGTIDGESPQANGWAIADKFGLQHTLVVELAEPLGDGSEQTLTFTLTQSHGDNHILGKFRLSAIAAAPVPMPQLSLPPQELVDAIIKPAAQRSDAERTKIVTHFRTITPLLDEYRNEVAKAEKALADYELTLPRCLVTTSMNPPRTVRILPRGNWQDDSGEVMQPALPEFLASVSSVPPRPAEQSADVSRLDAGRGAGGEGPVSDVSFDAELQHDPNRRLTRLDLAKWIAAENNPLTARVFVNRLWKQFFGVGISKNTDDLGSQGEWPVHPELLDWLAVEFMESGWDVKHMVRTIVMSRAYRQSSEASPELLKLDPENRLVARQTRQRFEAELVRDNALQISGLLVPVIGGPSVKPYQPEGYWENLNFPPRTYVPDAGADQYRRGLYTWGQRTFPHTSMLAFDAPTREECTADRVCSNIPQQALVLLNDPTYVEAARVFAVRILRAETRFLEETGFLTDAADPTNARIAFAWRTALQRDPRPDEFEVARTLYDKHLAEFTADPAAAESLLKVGFAPAPDDLDKPEVAAWASVARLLLNLHETITRN